MKFNLCKFPLSCIERKTINFQMETAAASLKTLKQQASWKNLIVVGILLRNLVYSVDMSCCHKIKMKELNVVICFYSKCTSLWRK